MDKEIKEVLRYLGHRGQGVDGRLEETVRQAVALCRELARPGRVFRFFPLERRPQGLALGGTSLLLTGDAIAKHLAGAERSALLAVTLGVEVERRILTLEHTDLTGALALDAAATVLVEALCDQACREIDQAGAQLGLCAGPRFSPGYGDLPLELQPGILAVLDAGRRIGLTCTGSNILLPRKSVTAVAGLFSAPQEASGSTCEACGRRESCPYTGG